VEGTAALPRSGSFSPASPNERTGPEANAAKTPSRRSKNPILIIAGVAVIMTLGLVAVLAASGSSGSSSFLDDPASLATSVQTSIGANIADPTNAAYQEGVTVTDSTCIADPTPRTFDCLLTLSNGSSVDPVVVVNAAGDDWISHAR